MGKTGDDNAYCVKGARQPKTGIRQKSWHHRLSSPGSPLYSKASASRHSAIPWRYGRYPWHAYDELRNGSRPTSTTARALAPGCFSAIDLSERCSWVLAAVASARTLVYELNGSNKRFEKVIKEVIGNGKSKGGMEE